MSTPRQSHLIGSVALVFSLLIPATARADGPLVGLVKDIQPGGQGSNPGFELTCCRRSSAVLNGVMYFPAITSANGGELWKTDGTSAGTVLVADILPGTGSSYPQQLVNVNGTLLFFATSAGAGRELWKSDGTAAGTVLVRDIWPGTASSIDFAEGTDTLVVGGVLYFVAGNSVNGYEMWRSDGTADGTFLLKDINPGVASGMVPPFITMSANPMANVNGTLFFAANDGVSGTELWSSDGTPGGTTRVGDIAPGVLSSMPSSLTEVDGVLLFMAYNGTVMSLWRSDGTTANTQEVKAVSMLTDCRATFGGQLYFAGLQAATGYELWRSDGTADGTIMLKDLIPGTGHSVPCRFTSVDDTLFFVAGSPGQGSELWKTDGTSVGTVLVKDINPGATSSDAGALPMLSVNGLLIFGANGGASGYELWKSDGTTTGTVMIHDFPAHGTPFILGVLGGHVLFAATDSDVGQELFKTLPTTSDFDGDGRSDVVVYRPSAGHWWINRSLRNFTTAVMVPWGLSTDLPAAADFDGDGKTDPTVFRPGPAGNSVWFVRQSGTNYSSGYAVQWGTEGDVPVPGYYNSDRFADVGVFRPSTGQWLVKNSSTGSMFAIEWGISTDVPVPADYDGDGRTDVAVYRPSTGQWLVKLSESDFVSVVVLQWGVQALNDVPVPADYDGDGKADPAVYRASTGHWLVARSTTSYVTPLVRLWGSTGDQPMPADFDGDGKIDFAIYRPSTGQWFFLSSRANYATYSVVPWGSQALGDVPIREK
jgi:ELWxxDGT repeat protein